MEIGQIGQHLPEDVSPPVYLLWSCFDSSKKLAQKYFQHLPAIDSMGLEMKVAATLFIVIKIIDSKVQ
jgi:hypothetical protein